MCIGSTKRCRPNIANIGYYLGREGNGPLDKDKEHRMTSTTFTITTEHGSYEAYGNIELEHMLDMLDDEGITWTYTEA